MRSAIIKIFIFTMPFLLMSCTNMLYYPTSIKYVDEKKLDHPPTEIDLSAAGKTDLLSWYFESKTNRLPITIVFAHGNAQNISAHFRSLYWTASDSLNFIIVGYPGYGPNTGSPSPASTVDTVAAAMTWVKKNRPNDKIVVFGQSLGGNVALRAASEHPEIPVCAVGIEGSFLSYKKIAQKVMSRIWMLWPLQWLPYIVIDDSRSIAKNIENLPKVPYLVIHGTEDQAIPLEEGKKLFEKLPEPKEFWEIAGGHHTDTFSKHKAYQQKFVDFVKKNCLKKN